MAFPTIRASSSCQSCRCRCRCRSGPPLGTSCRGGGGIEPDDDDDPSCDGTPVLAHHSGISCWPSIDRSVPPVPRPPPPSGLRANEQTRRGTVPTCSLEAGWRSCWCCSSSSSSHSYALSSSMGISEELLNASIPPSSHPSGPRRPPSQYSHKPVNDDPSRQTHTHTPYRRDTDLHHRGGKVRACRVWSGVAVLPSDKKTHLWPAGNRSEPRIRSVLFPLFLSASFRWFLAGVLACCGDSSVARVTSGQTEKEWRDWTGNKKKPPRRVWNGGSQSSAAPDERTV